MLMYQKIISFGSITCLLAASHLNLLPGRRLLVKMFILTFVMVSFDTQVFAWSDIDSRIPSFAVK